MEPPQLNLCIYSIEHSGMESSPIMYQVKNSILNDYHHIFLFAIIYIYINMYGLELTWTSSPNPSDRVWQ